MRSFLPVWAHVRIPHLLALILACLCLAAPAVAASSEHAALRFGILPTGGPAESRQDWQPLLDDLSKALGQPVESVSVSTYEGMHRAVADGRVDVAFLSGKLALDAVLKYGMKVSVRLTRSDGSPGYRSVLIARRNGPVRDLAAVFASPGRWRYARSETLSVSGYLVPEAQLFARRGIDSELHFKSIVVDNHQNNALAVANGEADVASNNSADLERFAKRFPRQHAQLATLWTSELIPHAVLVTSHSLSPPTREVLREFLTEYGRGADAADERRNLKRIHELSGFDAADNEALLPFAEIEYALQLQRARSARWVDASAKQVRLQRLRADYDRVRRRLSP